MNEKRSEWVKASIMLSNDPQAVVYCPECVNNTLEISDIYNESNINEFERIIFCKMCGAKTYMRMNKK